MSPRRQKWTIASISGVVGIVVGAGTATVKVGFGARAFAQEMITTAANEAVRPVQDRIEKHELEANSLRPVMLGWKEDVTRSMRRQDRLLLAICQATPRARCVEADTE